MAFDTHRNLRDGSITIRDGSTPPQTCIVTCDEGNLTWTENNEYQMSYCRGELKGKREGNDQPCDMSFTAQAMQIVGYGLDSSDPITPYDIITNASGRFISTSPDHHSVKIIFTVVDPDRVKPGPTEVITFPKWAPDTVAFSEAAEGNTIAYSGQEMGKRPVITHIAP